LRERANPPPPQSFRYRFVVDYLVLAEALFIPRLRYAFHLRGPLSLSRPLLQFPGFGTGVFKDCSRMRSAISLFSFLTTRRPLVDVVRQSFRPVFGDPTRKLIPDVFWLAQTPSVRSQESLFPTVFRPCTLSMTAPVCPRECNSKQDLLVIEGVTKFRRDFYSPQKGEFLVPSWK